MILAGDLNLPYDPADESNADFQLLQDELVGKLGLQDSGARQDGRHFSDRVDWVLYRSSPDVRIQVLNRGEDQRFRHPVNRGLVRKPEQHGGVLSDHPALAVCFLISTGDLTETESPVDPERPVELCQRR